MPRYDVDCAQNEAVIRFSDWLTTITVEKEVASGGGAGNAKIVLCGHRCVAYLTIKSAHSDVRH
jgi:hypothetical protein